MAHFLRRFPIIAAVIIAVVFLTAATSAAARPCRIFVISFSSIRNPSTNTFATITEIRSLSNPIFFINNPYDQNDAVFSSHQHNQNHHASSSRAQLGFSTISYDFTSLRDRTKDILSVVLALLFGFGCGSLAAAAMYLLWSVVSGHRDRRYDVVSGHCDRSYDDVVDEFDDDNGSGVFSQYVTTQGR